MGSAALAPPPSEDQDLQAPAERLHHTTRAPPRPEPRDRAQLPQAAPPPQSSPPRNKSPAPQRPCPPSQSPAPRAPVPPNQSPHRAQLPPGCRPPLTVAVGSGAPTVLITRGSCRFTPFLGTGYYFLIPINTCDSIYVQDKFISPSLFNGLLFEPHSAKNITPTP